MKQLTKLSLGIGIVSLLVGILLRFTVREAALGLAPSSFLEFSAACFLLVIAINTMEKVK